MSFQKVATTKDLAVDPLIEIIINGDPIALCRVGGEYFAMLGICPHAGGPLGQGMLSGTTVTCPWHAWDFDCRTGANDFEPDCTVPTYPTRVDGEDILIDLP